MKLDFDINNNVEIPELVLGKKNYDKFGSITNFTNLRYEYFLNNANKIDFTVYKSLNNTDCTLWNELKTRRLIWISDFDEWFLINVNTNDRDGILKKDISGTSLCEAELSQIYIVSTEINTEKDIARDDYEITKFYNPGNPKASMLHRILKKAPHYSIKHVDDSLWNIQRSFSFDNKTIYDVFNEIAEEIGCLFLYDSRDRSISVYDLQTNCKHCGHRGDFTDVCPNCGSTDLDNGYGYDTDIYVDSENLSEEITLQPRAEEYKNYFKIKGGDDLINAAVEACNPNGSSYIYSFSNEDKEDMSDNLLTKLNSYVELYDSVQDEYKEIMQDIYDSIDTQLYLESEMMPDIEKAETTAEQELAKLVPASLSPVSVTDVSNISIFTANNAVLSMAKCLINSTVYKISIIESSFISQRWKGKFRVENVSDEDDYAESSRFITVQIDDDYGNFVLQKIQKTIDRDDVYLVDLFDNSVSLNDFKAELKKYCLNRLTSFESAYQTIIDVMIESNVANSSTYGDIYNDLYKPYYKKLSAIQAEIQVRADELETEQNNYNNLLEQQKAIQSQLNIEKYLGDVLYKELCSFIREDVYENSNYISDGLNNSEIFQKAEELLIVAKKEITTASTSQWSLTASLFNLLAIPEFSGLTAKFEGGNWIRIGIDDKVFRLRLIHYTIDFDNIQQLSVEFSEVTETSNGLNDINSIISQANSMASNFDYVAHQAEQGASSFTTIDQIKNDGLNAALYNITTSINQEFKIDEHGLLGRQYDDILGDYLPEQVKLNNNILVFTDDYWETAKTALGKITYFNPIKNCTVIKYGLITDTVIAGELIGNDIIGGDIYSENWNDTTGSGSHINLVNGDFSLANRKIVYDSETDTLNLTGRITFESVGYLNESSRRLVKSSLGITVNENTINELMQCLGYTTEIASDHIISPYIQGGYLNITAPSHGSVIIDPLGITQDNYIFGIYNSGGNGIMTVDNDGNGIFSGKIIAESGKISIFNISEHGIFSAGYGTAGGSYWGDLGFSISNIFSISSDGVLRSKNTNDLTDYVSLDNGALKFYINNNPISSFSTVYWQNTSVLGTAVHSEMNAKYISFGNKSSSTDTTYTTNFLINYGLNPDSRTEGTIIFSDLLVKGHSTYDSYIGFYDGVNTTIKIARGNVADWVGTALFLNSDSSGSGVYVNGNLYCTGSFSCGGSKARTINTDTYGDVQLYAYETTTPYFGDLGSAELDENGLCYIFLDEIFKEAVLSDFEYYVFLQKYNKEDVYIIEKNSDFFVVKGTPYQKFDFEIKCRQKDTENIRLDRTCMDYEVSEDDVINRNGDDEL